MEQEESIILDVSKWIKAQGLTQEVFVVDGIRFELLALDVELKAALKQIDGYEKILNFAADSGVSLGFCRAMDNPEHKGSLSRVWSIDELQIDTDPCIKLRVGEKVCEISGLSGYIESVLEAEIEAEAEAERLEAERIEQEGEHIIDGDNLEESTVTADQMIADRIAAGLPA